MSRTRKLVAGVALGVVAAVCSAAPASGSVMVYDSDTLDECGWIVIVGENYVVSGGCALHLSSARLIELSFHTIFGEVHVDDCNMEAQINVNEGGGGFMSQINFFPGDSSCGDTTEPCAAPWSVDIGEPAAGEEHIIIDACLETLLGICNPLEAEPIALDLTLTGADYSAEIDPASNEFSNCEIDSAHWTMEDDGADGEIIIDH